jgi:hypothetical protein
VRSASLRSASSAASFTCVVPDLSSTSIDSTGVEALHSTTALVLDASCRRLACADLTITSSVEREVALVTTFTIDEMTDPSAVNAASSTWYEVLSSIE